MPKISIAMMKITMQHVSGMVELVVKPQMNFTQIRILNGMPIAHNVNV